MGAVLVHLDVGLRVALAVRVAAEVVAPLEDEHAETELLGAALGDREAEQSGADDDEVGQRGIVRLTLGQGMNSCG